MKVYQTIFGWANKTYVKNEITNFPLYSSISFDLTITSVFTPLVTGNTLYIYENDNIQLLLKQIIEDKKVQIIKLTPAHLSLLQDIVSETIITKLIVGGDILTPETCKNITNIFNNNVYIFNEYGPTEATVGCMTYIYQKDDDKNYASVPIGAPADNTQILILNNDLNLIPFGYNGQLFIGGKCLAKGYLSMQDKTKEKFINSPFNSDEILYSSGDIAKLFNNGIMEYIGRKDFQVKINGYRIETGEIQSKILNYNNIKECFVDVINMDNSKILCAYLVSETDIDVNDLKNFIMIFLPKYMIPKYFIRINQIPLTVNGKVNKSLLPLPQKNITNEYIYPCNELEQLLYDIFIKTLKIEKISVTQNIFDYLIDSLTIIKIQTKLYSFGISIDTQTFYNYPTIRDISNYISHKSNTNYNNLSDFEKIKIPDIIVPNSTNNYEYKNILFFGTTGFLGIHILHELLENTNAHIYCIIREKDNINSIERFKQKYSFYYNNLDSIINRITPITGDLNCERFNLLDQTYEYLCDNIDCVFSTAAIVKHFGDSETFYKTNVLGTQKIVDFCIKNNIPFHYTSTLSISGYGLTDVPNYTFTENDFYINQKYNDNIYVKSKLQAESVILNACKYKNLKASIYRIGNITNRYTDGVFQENASENAFLNRLSSIINLNCLPVELLDFKLEFTPVDYCAKFIVHLCKSMINNLNIYHLFNNNIITFNNFNTILELYGYKLKIATLNEFKNKVLNSEFNTFGIINYLSIIDNKNNNSLILDNNYTNKLLSNLNLKWPDITPEYMERIIIYLKKYNFIGDSYEK